MNRARFRKANEQQRSFARALDDDPERLVPFICECDDRGCTRLVLLTLPEYEHARSNPRYGVTLPGHEDGTSERVLETTDRFVLTEKLDVAGQVSGAGDPRS